MCGRERKSLIAKDVNRTDRTRIFYEGKDNCSLQLLNDILMTYVMYNFDLGKSLRYKFLKHKDLIFSCDEVWPSRICDFH